MQTRFDSTTAINERQKLNKIALYARARVRAFCEVIYASCRNVQNRLVPGD
ncbi:hypothetical protein [Citrobacter amalonaticus]